MKYKLHPSPLLSPSEEETLRAYVRCAFGLCYIYRRLVIVVAMKNRIKAHRKVKVKDLVPHEQNPRLHSDAQRHALRELLGEIGFARSVLAYELPDGRLKLIDGHLRQSELNPEEVIDVEVLDVNDEEAVKLLLAIDPLAQLASYDAETLANLRQTVEGDSVALQVLWTALEAQNRTSKAMLDGAVKASVGKEHMTEAFMILVECKDEQEQVTLLRQFKKAGLQCHAKTV